MLNALTAVIDPDLDQNIVEAGFVKHLQISDTRDVMFTVELTTPACPIKAEFERQCKEVVADLDWVHSVDVNMTAAAPGANFEKSPGRPEGLKDVVHVVGVYSCKGGAPAYEKIDVSHPVQNRSGKVDCGSQFGIHTGSNGSQSWHLRCRCVWAKFADNGLS